MINADVGYDIDGLSVSWMELSVRTIALADGQYKVESVDGSGIVLDKIHCRITFCLSVVLRVHCLLY